MPLRKTAIAVPDDLLAAVDRVARSRRESRNRFVTRVLEQAVRARRDADITRRLNDLFAAPEVAERQSREASDLDRLGSDWADERW
jgi:metal-responsive CopG/Arc/MetJ family transcriptional regulator